MHLFKLRHPEAAQFVASMRSGVVKTGKLDILVKTVLMDSGALSSSYVSAEWVDERRAVLKDQIRKVKGSVRLGDNKTVQETTERASLPVSFTDWEGKEHIGIVDFCVMSMPGLDMIVGLPDILDTYLDMFVDMLQTAREARIEEKAKREAVYTLEQRSAVYSLQERFPDLQYPWTVTHDEIAPEEEESYEPCSFTGPMYYLSKPHDEVVNDYKAMFETHIAEDWRRNTRIEELLLSEKALRVFVPQEWTGINGFAPLELPTKEGMPETHKPPCRPINPKLFEAASAEMRRMETYMYGDSDSPIACPLVIAPKATSPFIRICGDYVFINQWLYVGHYYIPHVMHELEKAAKFKYFIDLDWTNSFHQILLGEKTSNLLSVVTPWGLKRPKFLPEGVAPASGTLQKMVMSIFQDFGEWTVAIFDNLLVLVDDYEDGIRKLELIIDRCYERNVVLKFSKSWIGFQIAKFFGYKVTPGKYELDEDRKQAVMDAPMPTNTKGMQRFLGVAVFFNEFVPDFSTVTAHLYDMIKPTFVWDKAQWSVDYESEYLKVKEALCNSTAKYFPDYELDWILRVDASLVGVSAVLLQIVKVDDKEIYHPIGFKSKKLSGSAVNWDAHKREAYAVYWGVRTFSYYLHAKQFVLETDHKNLLYMEGSEVYIVVRWRVYLQSFLMLLRHISGKKNVVADWGSRMYMLEDTTELPRVQELHSREVGDVEDEVQNEVQEEVVVKLPETSDECLQQVHGGRMFHYGPKATWQKLNKYYPGHHIPFRAVQEFCKECPRCQKDKRHWVQDIKPVYRTLIPEHHRVRIGVDTVTVTPEDGDDNSLAVVVVNHKTKHVMIYPCKQCDGETAAAAIFTYVVRYGLVDEVISDPGKEFLNDAVSKLNGWLGIRHKVSLVDVHESNGVERTNQELLKLARTLCNDERIRDQWSKPWNIGLVEFALNSRVTTEAPHSAFELMFGTEDLKYFALPEAVTSGTYSSLWLQELNANLRAIREATNKFQLDLVEERSKENPTEALCNQFQPGDLVLYDTLYDQCQRRVPKLNSRGRGPYEVIRQVKNDVELRHLNSGAVSSKPVDRLALYSGTLESAKRLAEEDADQFEILAITAWRGNPEVRTTMELEILFKGEDGPIWRVWHKDLSDSLPFEEYCRANSELLPLLPPTRAAYSAYCKGLNSQPILEVQPDDQVFLNLRFFSTAIYDDDKVELADKWHVSYVVELVYGGFTNVSHKRIRGHIPVFQTNTEFNHVYVLRWGLVREMPANAILVDEDFVRQHPTVLELITEPTVRRRLDLFYA